MYISGSSVQTWLSKLKSLHFHRDDLLLWVIFEVKHEICPPQCKESVAEPDDPIMVPPNLTLSVIQRRQQTDFPCRRMLRAAGEIWQVHTTKTGVSDISGMFLTTESPSWLIIIQ